MNLIGTYEETVDYFRSAVSYLSELKKSDTRPTVKWGFVEKSLNKNLRLFYENFVLKVGSNEEKKEFKKYVNDTGTKKKKAGEITEEQE